jgi:hypothetical protein
MTNYNPVNFRFWQRGYPQQLYAMYGVTTVDALLEVLDNGTVSLYDEYLPYVVPKLIQKGYVEEVIRMVSEYCGDHREFQLRLQLDVAKQLIICHQRYPGVAEQFIRTCMSPTLMTRLLSELPISEKLTGGRFPEYCELLVGLGADPSYRNYRIIRKSIHNGYFEVANFLISRELAMPPGDSRGAARPSETLQCLIKQLRCKNPQKMVKSAMFHM